MVPCLVGLGRWPIPENTDRDTHVLFIPCIPLFKQSWRRVGALQLSRLTSLPRWVTRPRTTKTTFLCPSQSQRTIRGSRTERTGRTMGLNPTTFDCRARLQRPPSQAVQQRAVQSRATAARSVLWQLGASLVARQQPRAAAAAGLAAGLAARLAAGLVAGQRSKAAAAACLAAGPAARQRPQAAGLAARNRPLLADGAQWRQKSPAERPSAKRPSASQRVARPSQRQRSCVDRPPRPPLLSALRSRRKSVPGRRLALLAHRPCGPPPQQQSRPLRRSAKRPVRPRQQLLKVDGLSRPRPHLAERLGLQIARNLPCIWHHAAEQFVVPSLVPDASAADAFED